MGRVRKTYIATNIETGEKIVGDTLELYAAIDVKPKMIYQYAFHKCIYKNTWKIEVCEENRKIERKHTNDRIMKDKYGKQPKETGGVTYEQCLDWDRTTRPFKIASNRAKIKQEQRSLKKKSRFRTPYNCY